MRKVYVDLLCGGFTMLCAFFVYHDLGYKGSDDLGRERFDIDEFFCEGYNRVFVDVNKISTAFGRNNFREYINRQIREKNLVTIKNRSTQVSEGPALIAGAYEMNASNNSISQNPEKSTETEKKVSTDGKVVQMSLAEGANQQASDDIDALIKSAGIEGEATEIREELADLYDRARPPRRFAITTANLKKVLSLCGLLDTARKKG